MLVIMQYFGWRSNTVAKLETSDIVICQGSFRIYTSAFKTLGPGGLPCGVLKLSKLPTLFDICKYYVENVTTKLLFDNVNNLKTCMVCQNALKRLCDM